MTRRTRQHGQFGFAGATALLTLAFTGARLAASPAPQAEAETPHIQVDDRVDYGGAIAVFDVYYSSEDIDAEEATSGVIVATNSTHRDRFALYTHARIDGDVYVGVGGDPDNVIATWSGSEITGEQRALEEPLDLAAVSMPEGAPFDSPSEGHFSLWGSMTETIDSDRHFHHFQLSGTSRVTIEGDVTLVVDGNFQVTTFATVDLAPGATLRLYLGQHASLGGDVF